ncbi:MAG: phosphonate ABC transporter, permease protein PhnE [Deltaproteobacteria bacterium]|nr:phosphonate ABC transporter, permease protein PhnE [Deltaproteobacteria bacterium]
MPLKDLFVRFGIAVGAVVLLVWAYEGAEMKPLDLWTYRYNLISFAAGLGHPDFVEWRLYIRDMFVTIQIAIWGTLLAVIGAIPFGLMSSANLVPRWIYQPVRRLMDICRATNEMIIALFFIAALGLGPFCGVMALFIHTMGTLAKLFSEAVEAIDPRPVDGIRATGATVVEEINYGILPQVMPLWISYSLYRFESNVRSATVVGMVGGGGIGYTILDKIRSFDYGSTAAILIIIVVTVSTLDLLSARIRKVYI